MNPFRLAGLFLLLVWNGTMAAPEGAKEVEFVVGAFVFKVPKGWEMLEPSSAMRKAELKASGKGAGEAAETVFFCFGPGQGGSAADNVARWKGQVADITGEKVEEKEISGTKVTTVKLEGTYQSGMPGGPKSPVPGTVLLGAILESPEGNVYVKLTGPAAWVKKVESDFAAMIEAGAKNRKG